MLEYGIDWRNWSLNRQTLLCATKLSLVLPNLMGWQVSFGDALASLGRTTLYFGDGTGGVIKLLVCARKAPDFQGSCGPLYFCPLVSISYGKFSFWTRTLTTFFLYFGSNHTFCKMSLYWRFEESQEHQEPYEIQNFQRTHFG